MNFVWQIRPPKEVSHFSRTKIFPWNLICFFSSIKWKKKKRGPFTHAWELVFYSKLLPEHFLCEYLINSLTCHFKYFTFWAQWTFLFTAPQRACHFSHFPFAVPFFIHVILCLRHFLSDKSYLYSYPSDPRAVWPALWGIPSHPELIISNLAPSPALFIQLLS